MGIVALGCCSLVGWLDGGVCSQSQINEVSSSVAWNSNLLLPGGGSELDAWTIHSTSHSISSMFLAKYKDLSQWGKVPLSTGDFLLIAGLEDCDGSSSCLLGPRPWDPPDPLLSSLRSQGRACRSLHRLCLLANVTHQETLFCWEVRVSMSWSEEAFYSLFS